MPNYCCVSCKSAALPLFLLQSNALPAIDCINPIPLLLVSKIASLHAGAVELQASKQSIQKKLRLKDEVQLIRFAAKHRSCM